MSLQWRFENKLRLDFDLNLEYELRLFTAMFSQASRQRMLLPAIFVLMMICAGSAFAQIDDICGDTGVMPGLDSPFAHVPYVFGKITLQGFDPGAKFPKVTIIFSDGGQTANRYGVGKSGSYCFRRSGGSGTLVVEVDGVEVARRTLTSFGSSQQREDFEIEATGPQRSAPATVITANSKFSRPPSDKTVDLYKKAGEAEEGKDTSTEIKLLKEITNIDAADFVAWAKLGSLYFLQNSFTDADAAFRKCLEIRIDYTPAWINVGQLRIAQKQFAAAVEIYKYASSLEPDNARIYRLLGEAYLQNRQGSLAVEALDQALELDPTGQAECHLLKGHLYELAGAKQLATKEYKAFLATVPDHPDKKKLEKFIAENPE